MQKKIKILVVDDHKVVRRGLSLLFNNEPNFTIVGEANDGLEALDLIRKTQPNVVVTDITMPNMNGVELTEMIAKKHPKIGVVVLSMHMEEDYIIGSMNAGAKGYVSKDADGEDIIKAVYAAYEGEVFLTDSVSQLLAIGLIKKEKSLPFSKSLKTPLTKRELEILNLIVLGKSSKEIAVQLSISVRTVNVHKYNIMKKLKAPNSVTLVRIAIEQKLVEI